MFPEIGSAGPAAQAAEASVSKIGPVIGSSIVALSFKLNDPPVLLLQDFDNRLNDTNSNRTRIANLHDVTGFLFEISTKRRKSHLQFVYCHSQNYRD